MSTSLEAEIWEKLILIFLYISYYVVIEAFSDAPAIKKKKNTVERNVSPN